MVQISSDALSTSTTLLVRNERALLLTSPALDVESPHLQAPHENLYRSLYDQLPEEAQWWSRGRAYVTEAISPSMWGSMKVFGKRLSAVTEQELFSRWLATPPSQRIQLMVQPPARAWMEADTLKRGLLLSLSEAKELLNEWITLVNQQLNLHEMGELDASHNASQRRWSGARRVVGAVALSTAGEVLGSALNMPHLNPTYHAEWCLLDLLWSEGRWSGPEGVTLITTLKPCKRCAGLWATYCPLPLRQVHYLRDDPGPSACHTALDQGSYAWREAIRWRSDWESVNQRGPS